MGMSRRAYAAHRGCSESAVRKAIATGRIATEDDGTIDAATADAEWGARTDPAQAASTRDPDARTVELMSSKRTVPCAPDGGLSQLLYCDRKIGGQKWHGHWA